SGAVRAGEPFDLSVYAFDAYSNLITDYAGGVAFSSSDPDAVLPAAYTFRPEDGGIAAFPGGVTLRTPGTQSVVAVDLETFTIFGVATFEVTGGAGPGFGGAAIAVLDPFLVEVLVSGSKPARR